MNNVDGYLPTNQMEWPLFQVHKIKMLILIRNHEINPLTFDNGPFKRNSKISLIDENYL